MDKFLLELQTILDNEKSKNNINKSIDRLQHQLDKLKIQAELDPRAAQNLANEIGKLVNQKVVISNIGINQGSMSKTGQQIGQVISDSAEKAISNVSSNGIGKYKLNNIQDKLDMGDYDKELANLQATYRRLGLTTDIQNWLSKNSRASKEAKDTLQAYYNELAHGRVSVDRLEYINKELQKIDAKQRGVGKLGKTLKDQFTEAAQGFTQCLSVSSGVMFLVSKTREAISEIKELDDILTEISKTSDMTEPQLKQLGMDSYDKASKYGRVASDYLTGVQKMNRSGFYGEKGTSMAEQSLLAQSAGDLSSELADKYILSLNAAYKYNGEAEKINAALDGMNNITNKNSVAMEDMAEAMTKTGTVAAGYKVKVEDLSAMIGTMESVTKLGGDEVGNAAKAILINLQNVTSGKIVDTLDKANASMTEMVNGTEKLRDPINILRDLAKTFNQLDEDDPLRAEILTNIGQKDHANKLGALLQNMDMYDKMLVDYSEGDGSALEESNKSAENLTGTINKLHNSWTEFVNGIIDSDGLKSGVELLNGLVETLGSVSDAFSFVTSFGGNINELFGTIGAISGFIMNRNGNGERTIYQW